MLGSSFFAEVAELLTAAAVTQEEAIGRAADLMSRSIAGGGVVHFFGSGHSQMLCQEVFYRAGGLAAVNAILDDGLSLGSGAARSSQLERMEGYGQVLLSQEQLQPGEVMVIISTSGRNAVPVDVALEAKRQGLFVVALTSISYSQAAPSRHSSGKLLMDVADVVIDNLSTPGDAILSHPDVKVPFGPASTVVGAAILQALMAEVVERLVAGGTEPPVFLSGNLNGADAHNAALVQRYRGRCGRLAL